MKKTRGVLLGKFSPLHIGHLSLIDFAKRNVDHLIILVDSHGDIDLSKRIQCLKQENPNLDVRAIKENTYQEPSESPDFWNFWEKIIKKYVPEKIDYVIGSMDYVDTLSQKLNIKSIVVDIERKALGVSASDILKDLKNNWQYLAPSSKAMLSKKIAIVGTESSGKSSLCEKLAKYYSTVMLPEYARTYIEQHGRDLLEKDFKLIAKRHFDHYQAISKFSSYYMFLDTEKITTSLWSEFLIGKKMDFDYEENIDLYILMPLRNEWVEDEVRYQEEYAQRKLFYEKMRSELILRKKSFLEVKSLDWDDILKEVTEYLDNF